MREQLPPGHRKDPGAAFNYYKTMNPKNYTMPNPPRRARVSTRRDTQAPEIEAPPEPVIVSKETHCFVTPPLVAASMVEYLEATPNMNTLEPSAGTGNLVKALLDSGHSRFNLTLIEKNRELFYMAIKTRAKDYVQTGFGNDDLPGFCECFLEYEERARGKIVFDRILMNPPFNGRECRKHVAAARRLLKDEGFIVALLPCTFPEDESTELLDELPDDTFAGIKVRTKILKITK